MLGAYGWAFLKPIRKLYYNLTVTFISVAAALVIGGFEALGLIGDKLQLKGPFWNAINVVSDNFGMLGCAIVMLFIVTWLISLLIYHAKGARDSACKAEPPAGAVMEVL
jgi:high-affinity nickel-transport protein